MSRAKFQGKTKAYHQFADILWRSRTLVDLGVVGIDMKLEEQINPLIEKFSDVHGIRGRRPKEHQPHVKSKKGDGESIHLEFDQRTAFHVKQAI